MARRELRRRPRPGLLDPVRGLPSAKPERVHHVVHIAGVFPAGSEPALVTRDAELESATPRPGRTLLEILAELDQFVAATIANRQMVQLTHILTA